MLVNAVIDFLQIIKSNFFSITFLVTITYVINYYISYFNRTPKIPGPFPLPIIGNLHQVGFDLVEAHRRFYKAYGEIYEFYTGNVRNVVICRPDFAEKIWGPATVKNAKFIMRNAYSVGVDELGLGTKGIVLNRDIESWTINRKFLIQSISTKPFLRESIELVSRISDDIFKYWKIMEKNGVPINIPEWMNAFGTDVVITTATGKNITSITDLFNKSCNIKENSEKGIWNNGMDFTRSIHTYNESMSFMMLLSPFIRRNFPGLKNLNKKYLDNRDWINNELEKVVSERRKEIENTPSNQPLKPTILTLLLTTNTERDLEKINPGKFDRPLEDEELSSILREVFTGGLDTTSNTLSFLFYYIAKDRNIYEKMRNEVLEVYGTLDNPELTLESFDKLKYFDDVILESIRIFPTIPSLGRSAVDDFDFGEGIKIKGDTTVYTNFDALNHNPKYFKNPEEFNPDRFRVDKEPSVRYSFTPFGGGVRICPGRAWSNVQMKTLLVKLVCTFDIELTEGSDLKYIFATTTRLTNVNIRVKALKQEIEV